MQTPPDSEHNTDSAPATHAAPPQSEKPIRASRQAKRRADKFSKAADARALDLQANATAFVRIMRANIHLTDDEVAAKLKAEAKPRPVGKLDPQRAEKCLLAYRLQQRGLTGEAAATAMEISRPVYSIMLNEARALLRVDPHKIDIPQAVGETLDFYADVRGMALAVASSSKATTREKLHAAGVALQAERDKNDFLARVGVYSPAIVQQFQTLLLQHVTVMLGTANTDEAQAERERFFTRLAGGLLTDAAEAADTRRGLQSVANKQSASDLLASLVQQPTPANLTRTSGAHPDHAPSVLDGESRRV